MTKRKKCIILQLTVVTQLSVVKITHKINAGFAMEKMIKDLIDLGLNKYEANAYRALLNQRLLTASEISKQT